MEGLQVKEVSEKSNVCCHKCRDQFQEEAELQNYQENAYNFYRCKSCGKEETSLAEFEFHLQTYGGFKLFKCFTCQEMFSFLHELNNHLPTHASKKESSEGEEECLETQIEFEQEMKTEPQGEYFERRSVFKDQNAEEESLEIDESGKTADNEDLSIAQVLKRSCSDTHEPIKAKKRKMHRCAQCSYTCNRISVLKQHLLKHSNTCPFECAVCGKTYRYKSSLKVHMQSHNTEKKHNPCPVCGKVFLTTKSMRRHLKTHNPERKFVCDWKSCQYETNIKWRLQCHRRTHTGEKPFKCEICDAKFNLKHILKDHIGRFHEPCTIPCTHCNKKFAMRKLMNDHFKRKHKQEAIPCSECGKLFVVKRDVNKHMKNCY